MPFGRLGAISASRALTLSITVSALAPKRCRTMPLATSPSPLSSVMPRRSSGPSSTRATSPSRNGVAAVALEDDVLDVGDALEIAAPAHHELELGEFDACARRRRRCWPGSPRALVRAGMPRARRRIGIDDDIVLLHEAADAGDFRHALGLGGGEAELPVLQASAVSARVMSLATTAY